MISRDPIGRVTASGHDFAEKGYLFQQNLNTVDVHFIYVRMGSIFLTQPLEVYMKLFISVFVFSVSFLFMLSCGTDSTNQYSIKGDPHALIANGCFSQDDKLIIEEYTGEHKNCISFLNQYEEPLKKYLFPGDFINSGIPNYTLTQKTAMLGFFRINQKRIAAKSNEKVELFYQSYLLNEIRLSSDSDQYKNSIEALNDIKRVLSDLPDGRGVKRPASLNVLVFPKKYVDAQQKENERALYDVSSENREFEKNSALQGKYPEAELYDALKRVANIFYIPSNGLIVAVQDLVDGKNYFKTNTSPYDPFQDSFFYLYREGQTKRVIEVLANLRSSSSYDSPYQQLSEYGLAKFFGDVHRKSTDIPALRGVGRWDVGSGSYPNHRFDFRKLYNESANSGYNMHPGDHSGRSSAGCATIRNRASSGYSRDYYVFMSTILQYSFHSNDYLGDDYDQEDPAIAARINLNAVYLKKIINYNN